MGLRKKQKVLWEKMTEAEAAGSRDKLAVYTHEWLRQKTQEQMGIHTGSTLAMLETLIQRATGINHYKRPKMIERHGATLQGGTGLTK